MYRSFLPLYRARREIDFASRGGAVSRAFSLVELLVVLAIITILTAILLPTLQRARAQANQTQCLNNIRQIGMGIAMYVNDWKEYSPADALPQYNQPSQSPVFQASRRTGLLNISQSRGFNRFYLSCPEGWASSGDSTYYGGKGLNKFGSAYMDYAYWPQRYPQAANSNDVRWASFKYSAKQRGTKILVTDIVTDLGGNWKQVTEKVGEGNHANVRGSKVFKVRCTDGKGRRIGPDNTFRSHGGAALFSDYSAHWFDWSSLTGQTQGICYPTPDQWVAGR